MKSKSMLHKDILKRFKKIYPIDDEDIECWFPNGKGSIRIRLKKGSEESKFWQGGDLILTFRSWKDWRLETVDSYLESIKIKEN